MDTDKAAIVEGTPSDAIAPTLGDSFAQKCRNSQRTSMLLGQKVYTDDSTERRISRAQRGIGLNGILALLFFIFGRHFDSEILLAMGIVFCGNGLVFCGFLYYRNVSFVMVKRLVKEPNVVTIVVLTFCHLSIEIGRPRDPTFSPINALMYVLVTNSYVFMDALVSKSRYLVLGVGVLFILMNIYNLYGTTLGDWNVGLVLLDYTIQGKRYKIMKRSTQRSIYLQLLLVSVNAVKTMFTDKTMKFMLFAKGNIYRSTGTASADIEDGSFVTKVKHEMDYRQTSMV